MNIIINTLFEIELDGVLKAVIKNTLKVVIAWNCFNNYDN